MARVLAVLLALSLGAELWLLALQAPARFREDAVVRAADGLAGRHAVLLGDPGLEPVLAGLLREARALPPPQRILLALPDEMGALAPLARHAFYPSTVSETATAGRGREALLEEARARGADRLLWLRPARREWTLLEVGPPPTPPRD